MRGSEVTSHEQFDMKGLAVIPYHEAKEVTRFELSLAFGEFADRMTGALEYDEKMFTPKTTSQMLEDYVRIIGLMADDPERAISTISLTRTEEFERISSNFAVGLEV